MTLTYSFTKKLGNYSDNNWVVIYYKAAIKVARELGYRIKFYGCDFMYENIKDDVDEFINIENEEFILTDDLKIYIHSREGLDCVTVDGDLFLRSKLNIPMDCDVLFERRLLNSKNKKFLRYMDIFKKYGAKENIVDFDYDGHHACNVGILKFNNQETKDLLIKSYYDYRKWFLEVIEPAENLTKWNDPAIIICEYYFARILEKKKIPYKFCSDYNDYTHYASEMKFTKNFFKHVNDIFHKKSLI
jgi:hypothetical protein